MVAVVERVAIRDWHIEAENGDRQEVKAGQSYTTTLNPVNGFVVLFSSFWVKVPIDVFAEIENTMRCPKCHSHIAIH